MFYFLLPNRNFRKFWLNGKHPHSLVSVGISKTKQIISFWNNLPLFSDLFFLNLFSSANWGIRTLQRRGFNQNSTQQPSHLAISAPSAVENTSLGLVCTTIEGVVSIKHRGVYALSFGYNFAEDELNHAQTKHYKLPRRRA